MALRATHQWVDVIRSGVAQTRVTQQYIEVLVISGIFDVSCIENMTDIGDTANADTFTLDITESITISDTARASFISIDITETIIVSETLHVIFVIEESITESITISESVDVVLIPDIQNISELISVSDYLDGELNSSAIISRSIEETITINSSMANAALIKTVYITQHFDPDDFVPKTRLVNDPVTGQLITETWIDYSSIQDFIETELIRAPQIYTATVTDNIIIYDTEVSIASPSTRDDITVTDNIDIEINVSKTITESVNIGETLRYEIVSRISLCTYSPFIGGSSDPDAPSPPSLIAPTEIPQDDFQLYHPVISPSLTLTLKGPESGDREGIQFQRVSRRSRGLSLQIYADPQWPKVKRLSIGANVRTEAKAQEVLDFVIATVGQEIGFRDWRNRSWKGIIENPQNPIVRDKRGSWTVAIEFEAELTEL